MSVAKKILESASKLKINEAKLTDEDINLFYGDLPAAVTIILDELDLIKYTGATEGKLDKKYQSRGSISLDMPIDVKTIGPLAAVIKKLTLSFEIQKLDKVGPKGEVYWCPLDFKYEFKDGGYNGAKVAIAWLTATGEVVGIRKSGE